MTSTLDQKHGSAGALNAPGAQLPAVRPAATRDRLTDRQVKRKARFWDRIAKKYARSPVADEAAYRKKLDITQGYFRPDMEVLEFGCGTGTTALIHAPFVRHIRAIDISANMLAIARRKAEAENVANVRFERQTIEDLEAPAQSFDAVMGHSILHLLDDPDAAIAKVHDLLKPGGIFISSTVCLAGHWFRFIAPAGRMLGLLPLVRFLTPQELRDSLTRTGFEIDHFWQPPDGRTAFIVAKKPA